MVKDNAEIERGEFSTAADIKEDARKVGIWSNSAQATVRFPLLKN
ncbi:hypothetical protein ACSBL2_09670 [Pedobacter sp. AW31-3R]